MTDSFCDCPVESATCKHVVAVLFALRDELRKQTKQSKSGQAPLGKLPKRLTVAELVKQVSADELRAIIAEYAVTDKTFATKLQLHFADKDERIDVRKNYTELIRKTIRAHGDRHGFIDYRATFKLAKEIESLLSTGVKLVGQHNFKDAMTLGMVLLQEMMTVLNESDDSAGNMGGVVSGAIELLQDIGLDEDTAPPLRRELFDALANELTDNRYFDYGDMGLDLLDATYQISLRLSEPDVFLALIDRLLPLHKSSTSTFYQDQLRTLRVKFLRETGHTDEADQQMQASMDVVEVRAQVVEEAMRINDYDRAKTLLLEGIRLAEEKKHPGIVHQWEEKLLTIAVAEQHTDAIRRLAKKFALDSRFDPRYFRQWKATFSTAEWTAEYNRLVARIRQEMAEGAKNRKPSWGYNEADELLYRLQPLLTEEK